MYKRMLFILSTLALLIYPLSVSAQSSFSLSLDVNSATGDQAVTSLNVSADQVIAIQIFGNSIQNANALAVRFEYDATQVTYDGFDVGSVLPSAQALPEHGTNPTFVEIGIASLGGQATINSGLMGTIRFRTTAAFSGTSIRLLRAELSRGGRFETITPNIRIELQTPPAPTNFSLSLDADGAAGDQAVTSLNTSADQVIAIQIFGTDIQNANGVSIRFEYDASQVTYDGFDVGSVLPNAQALPEHGTTFVEIGIVSLGSQATVNSGLIGTIRFRATAAFSGATIQLVRAELSRGGRFETITPNLRVELQSAPASANFSLSLDADGATGDQAVTSLDVSTDQVVAIQIFGTDIQNANGVSVRFEYDTSQVTYDSFDVGSTLPSAQALPEHGTNPTFVQIGIVSFGGQATVNNGLIGTIRFRTTAAFSGTSIRLVNAELGRGGRFETITPNIRIELQLQALTPDFDGDGRVGFSDFLLFGSQFGARQGDGRYEARFDLDSDGAIGFGDFLIFGSDFGKEVSSGSDGSGGGSGGGGGGGSPDLIVESPSVSDSTLTAGQSFTLRATVRNQGSGQAAATTLRYYQSSDATITVNDTQIGTDAVGSLTTSGTSAESISLNAPSRAGTYYYGACVEQVSGEPEIDNNCSNAVRVTVSGGSGLVAIPDENLRAAIEAALGKANGATITQAEMSTLTRLDAPNSDISDLTGLEFATGLTYLRIDDNLISDLSALAGLTSLRQLSFRTNIISDISALSGLTNLVTLELDGNIISDFSPISGLTNLRHLYLQSSGISDLSPLISLLSGLINLRDLYLCNNAISDLSPLANANLTSLRWLSLCSNLISDLSPLASMTNLTDLDLERNLISDVSPLSGLSRLDWLDIESNLISDISPLAGLTNLTYLDISYNLISNISPLANLTSLTKLVLYVNTISDISPLSGLTNLTELWLNRNAFSDISPLSGLTNLTVLDLQSSDISDISLLSGLTNLTHLYLYNNAILDVSALAGLTNLETLRLDQNAISNLTPLSGLTNLTWLNLDKNIITDISPLSNLTGLETLWLFDNTISDLAPLVANTGLGSGDEVDVRYNPLSDTSLNTHIPALQGRGVNVLFGASKPAVGEKETRMPSKPVVKENERRMPRAMMKPYGVEAREEAEYMSRRWLEMGEDVISQKASLRDKARREAR